MGLQENSLELVQHYWYSIIALLHCLSTVLPPFSEIMSWFTFSGLDVESHTYIYTVTLHHNVLGVTGKG